MPWDSMRISEREAKQKGWDANIARMGDGTELCSALSGHRTNKKEGCNMESRIYGDITPEIEPRVAAIGVGGAGCNITNDIYWADGSIDTIAINTDKEALKSVYADKKLYICKEVTKGEGTHGDQGLGRKCAKIHSEEIERAIADYDIIFIIAGMGGGTGSGAASVLVDIAQRQNKIVFSILVNPFSFEMSRSRIAKESIAQVKAICPMTVVIDNDKILTHGDMTMEEAFKAVNNSIQSFISQQKRKTTEAFMAQLSNIGETVREESSVDFRNNNGNGMITDIL